MTRNSARRAIGHGERDDPVGVVAHPALGGLAKAFRDALCVDAEPLQFLKRHRVLARSRANVEKRGHVGGSDLAELHALIRMTANVHDEARAPLARVPLDCAVRAHCACCSPPAQR